MWTMLTVLNLVKTEPELELFQSYISHVPKVSFISLISHPYIIKIKTIFLLFEFWKKIQTPSPPQNCLHYEQWTFSTYWDIFCFVLNTSLGVLFSFSWLSLEFDNPSDDCLLSDPLHCDKSILARSAHNDTNLHPTQLQGKLY